MITYTNIDATVLVNEVSFHNNYKSLDKMFQTKTGVIKYKNLSGSHQK